MNTYTYTCTAALTYPILLFCMYFAAGAPCQALDKLVCDLLSQCIFPWLSAFLFHLHLLVLLYLVFCFAPCVFIMFTLEPPLESIILAISTLSAHTTNTSATTFGSRLVAQPNGSGTGTATDTGRPRYRSRPSPSVLQLHLLLMGGCWSPSVCLCERVFTWSELHLRHLSICFDSIAFKRQSTLDTRRILMLRYCTVHYGLGPCSCSNWVRN